MEDSEIIESLLSIEGVSMISQSIKSSNKKDKSPEKDILCYWDKRKNAEKYCTQCKRYFCNLCCSVLHSNPALHNHTYIDYPKRSVIHLETCRCGRGASKGKNSCNTKRCPCFKVKQKCVNCSCVLCLNKIESETEKTEH